MGAEEGHLRFRGLLFRRRLPKNEKRGLCARGKTLRKEHLGAEGRDVKGKIRWRRAVGKRGGGASEGRHPLFHEIVVNYV